MTLLNSITEPGQPWVIIMGKGVRLRRANVEEVDAETVQRGAVLAPAVQHGCAAAPVVAIAPIIAERAHLLKRCALTPIAYSFAIGPGGQRQPSP